MPKKGKKIDDATMAAMSQPGNPFGDMMQEAVRMKTSANAKLRTDYDNSPPYIQHSMFPRPEVTAAREAPDSASRLSAAALIKDGGNALFREKNYVDANFEYERALSVFRYLRNSHADWRNKGIRDEDMTLVDDAGGPEEEGPGGRAEVASFKVACLNNIAAVQFHLKKFGAAVVACNDALNIDSANAKALHRRALARCTPMSAGAVEIDMAVKDLAAAAAVEPANRAIRKLLGELRASRAAQRQKDKSSFGGMFARGSITKERHISPGEAEATARARAEAARRANEAQAEQVAAMAAGLEAQGRHKEAAEVRAALTKAQADAKQKQAGGMGDFRNPTPEMMADAKKQGIDLADPETLRLLQQMQGEHEAKAEGGGGGTGTAAPTAKGSSKGGGDALRRAALARSAVAGGDNAAAAAAAAAAGGAAAAADEGDRNAQLAATLGRMSKADMLGFMAQQSIPHDAAASEEELRAALTKALQPPTASARAQVWRVVIPLTVLFVLFRLWQMFSQGMAAARHNHAGGGHGSVPGAGFDEFDAAELAADDEL